MSFFKFPITIATVIGCVGLVISEPQASGTEDFEVDGTMTVAPQRYGVAPFSNTVHFLYSNPRWQVSIASHVTTNDLIKQLSDDGDSIYKLVHIENNNNPLAMSWVAQIHPTGFPTRVFDPQLIIMYYAYGSSRYLSQATNQLVYPIKFQPTDLEAGEVRVKGYFIRKTDSLRLPEEITFQSLDGNTNAVISSSSFTNLGSFEIPLRVTVTRYAPHGGILVLYTFQAERVQATCSLQEFKPDLPVDAIVEDYRFSHGQAYVPPIEHGRLTDGWPTEARAKLNAGYKVTQLDWEEINRQTKLHKEHRHTTLIRLLFLLLIVGGGPYVALTYFRSVRQKSHSN